ncbi:hypothetical protein BKK79_35740 [Cupriavidus sp. USMAA2-4]|uniref:phage baseplate plug family protein n=1 Tax=Cupriavidus sp. USMAA2-4 TaxID=876364 RepID=UPI0008A7165D|nr:hypothetical protein [Cupriavidus sp. USMAA2-4]AOY96848.1 hypothetical protein BKK79_35740 [Cupriavidus sp. USMAA2-4]
MNIYEVPLSPTPQTFLITLGGVDYRLTLQYRAVGDAGWVLDIADASGNRLLSGVPLTTGADLLAQYRYLGFAGSLWVQGAESPDDVPTFDDLGVGSHVFWVTS